MRVLHWLVMMVTLKSEHESSDALECACMTHWRRLHSYARVVERQASKTTMQCLQVHFERVTSCGAPLSGGVWGPPALGVPARCF